MKYTKPIFANETSLHSNDDIITVWWMIARESGHSASAHPAWRSLRWKDHALNKDVGTVCGDLITGNLTFEALPMIRDISGGLLCDEPGLGKTITLLAVM